MAESSTEKGVNEISAGEKNLDSEFKKSSGKKVPSKSKSKAKNKKKNAKKKAKKNKRKK